MQAQSRLAMSGGSSSPAPEEEHEAVIRELTRGRELTAQLRAAALGALRGQGQAEATAALILQEVSRAFNVCLTIMSSPAADRAPPPPPVVMPGLSPAAAVPPELAAAPPRRNREDSIPREQRMTTSPHYDGYQWRKYGQKRITNTPYPRCYYRCSFHRERSCRATKQVQQWSGGDPPEYLVMYFNDHTCDTAAWEPAEAAANPPPAMMLDLSSSVPGLAARRGGGGALDQEEHERRVLVSSLACVLGAHRHQQSPPPPPPDAAAGSAAAAVAVNVAPDASAAAAVDDAAAAAGMPRLDVDVVGLGLDDMDYDVFGDSYVPFY